MASLPKEVEKTDKKPSSRPKRGSKKPVPVSDAGAPKSPRKWVIVQLSSNGEREKNIPSLIRSARHILQDKNIEVCVPAISQKVREDSHTMFYWDGYIFIEHVEGKNYLKLNDTSYFQSVLCKPGPGGVRHKSYCFLTDKDLEPMRRGLQTMKIGEFSENDEVKIIKGQFKNLIGVVSFIHEGGENVQVFVGLRSKKILMEFPASYLVKINEI